MKKYLMTWYGMTDFRASLKNIVRYFDKFESRAVLVSCSYPKNKVVRKKIDDSKNIQSVSGNNLFRQLEEMIQPGGRHR